MRHDPILRPAQDDEQHAVAPPAAVVSLQSRAKHPRKPPGVKLIYLCRGCAQPEREGSGIDGLVAFRGPDEFNVTAAPLAFAVPNHGSPLPPRDDLHGGGGHSGAEGSRRRRNARRRPFLNPDELRGAVAVLLRGGDIPIADKVLQAQEYGGAAGAIVIDDGRCDEDFRGCGLHATAERGFGTRDHWPKWAGVRIPCLLVTAGGGDRLREAMAVDMVDLPGFGMQYVSSIKEGAESSAAQSDRRDEL